MKENESDVAGTRVEHTLPAVFVVRGLQLTPLVRVEKERGGG